MKIFRMFKTVLLAAVMTFSIATNANAFTEAPGRGVFLDPYEFTLSGPSFYDATIKGILGGFVLLDSDDHIVDSLFSLSGSAKATDGFLSAGSYTAIFGGYSTRAGEYSFNVTAVPEPNNMGMLAAGLSMLGFVALRRRSKA